MAVAKKAEPKQTELLISYSVGAKVQIVKYELTADVHLSRSEKYNVEGYTKEEIDAFYEERYAQLHIELGDRVVAEVEEMKEPA